MVSWMRYVAPLYRRGGYRPGTLACERGRRKGMASLLRFLAEFLKSGSSLDPLGLVSEKGQ
jgi:hypothetical protein